MASETNQIPCDSVQSLRQDIQKAIDDVDCDVYDSDERGVSKGELF